MQVSASSSIGQDLTLASAVAQGRSTKTVSKEAFGSTRKTDSFERTLTQHTSAKETYSPQELKKMHMEKALSHASSSLTVAGDSTDSTRKTAQFTQNDVDMLLKLFGSSAGDGNYMASLDLDQSGTIDLDDLNAMLTSMSQSLQPDQQIEAPSAQYSQEDIDLLTDAFGAQVGDENYSEALDLDGDGIIGLDDLNLMLTNLSQSLPATESPNQSTIDQLIAAFGNAQGDEGFVAELDLNADGTLNLDDLNELLNALSGN